jgi:hypothetical protein
LKLALFFSAFVAVFRKRFMTEIPSLLRLRVEVIQRLLGFAASADRSGRCGNSHFSVPYRER